MVAKQRMCKSCGDGGKPVPRVDRFSERTPFDIAAACPTGGERGYTFCTVRNICFCAAFLFVMAAHPQGAVRPLISSHDIVDGPFAGAHRDEVLKIFQSGRVVYILDATIGQRGEKPLHQYYESALDAQELRQLTQLINRQEILALPARIAPKTRPIDFFWQESLEIRRKDGAQRILIENFYPFLNERGEVYADALIDLECRLQSIKSKAANGHANLDWCADLLQHNRTFQSSEGDKPSNAARTACFYDLSQPRVVAGVGWGTVRIGATRNTAESLLGEGSPESTYSDSYFMSYPQMGVEVLYNKSRDAVVAIYFYNGQRGDERIGAFCGQTDKNISWESNVDDLRVAYGVPEADYSGSGWERIVFQGIDFRFENGKMVRIGVPGQ